jgi:hypothetical protein
VFDRSVRLTPELSCERVVVVDDARQLQLLVARPVRSRAKRELRILSGVKGGW